MLLTGLLLLAAASQTADVRTDCREQLPLVPAGMVLAVPAAKRALPAALEAHRDIVVDGVDVQDELFAVASPSHETELLVTWDAASCLARVEVYRLRRYSHKGRAFAYLLWVVPHVGSGVMGGVLSVCLFDRDGDGQMDSIAEAKGARYGPDDWVPPIPLWLARTKGDASPR